MFGVKAFTIVLISGVVGVVLAESSRQKKDVHHMIILNGEVRPAKSHRHKNYLPNVSLRRKPGRNKNNNKYSSASLESFEDVTHEDDFIMHKPKSKRQQPKRGPHHKDRHHQHDRYRQQHQQNRLPSNSFSNSKWVPVTSQELFGKSHPQVFPGGYKNGALHFSQPVPIEVTTSAPFSMPPNSFLSFESTLYPPLNSDGLDMNPHNVPQLPLEYKPYDYSVLAEQPQNLGVPTNPEIHVPANASPVLMGNPGESKGQVKKGKDAESEGERKKKKKDKRNRGTNRFRATRRDRN